MQRIRIILSLLSLLHFSGIAAETKTLEDFYNNLGQAASTLKSQADLDAQRAHLKANEAQKGWEVFAGISGGYQKSPFAKEPFGRFFDPLARVGLRYPLLGSAEKQQRAINDAATQVRIEDIRLDWSKRLALLFIEENYAAYWSAQKLLTLNEAYLELRGEGVEKKLLERRETGLLLSSDYYEFLSAFEQAERAKIEFSSNREQALTRLSYLTQTTIFPFQSIKPQLARISHHASIDIDQPDLRILRAQIENLQNARETEKWQGIESDFSATVFGGPAIPHPSSDAAQYGYGGAVGFNIRMPLEIVSYRKNEKSRLNSELNSLHAEYRHRDQELNLEFNSLLNQYQSLTQQVNFQLTRLDAARESVRERFLRLQVLDGDVLEQYLRAINQYYRTAVEYVEAETEQWKTHIRLRQFIILENAVHTLHSDPHPLAITKPLLQATQFLGLESANEEKTNTLKTATVSTYPNYRQTHAGYGVYVWDYSELLKQSEFWQLSRTFGINRILLSLNADEIASVTNDATQLNGFLREARHHNMKIELLLGDPDWILPENRDHLVRIIMALKHIDFDGLHLDIEPDQLESQLEGKARLDAFLESIRQAAAISVWPIGVSIHPRYLEEQSSYHLCIPCQLENAGVREIAVMYYSMSIDSIVQTLQSAMTRHPGLTFSLAQSLERELGPENSYATQPQALFRKAMQVLRQQLQSPNFGELIIQSWHEWKTYHYENSL